MKKILIIAACCICLTAVLLVAVNKKAAPEISILDDESIPKIYFGDQVNVEISEDLDKVNEKLAELSYEKIGVIMQYVPGMGAATSRTDFPLYRESNRDIFMINKSSYSGYIEKGYIIPLNRLLKEHGKEIIDYVDSKRLELVKVNGEIYGVPKPMIDIEIEGIMVNKELCKGYGIDMSGVSSWEDMEPIFEKVSKMDTDIFPFAPNTSYYGFFYRSVIGDVLAGMLAMVYYDDPGLTVYNLFKTEEYQKQVYTARDWYLKGYCDPDVVNNPESGVEMVMAGKAFCTSFVVRPDEVSYASVRFGDEYEIIEFDQKPYLNSINESNYIWVISSECENSEAAAKALNLLYSDQEILDLLIYGEEGAHYIKTQSGSLEFPANMDYDSVPYKNKAVWAYNHILTSPWEGTPEDIKERMNNFKNQAIVSPAYGFQFDPEGYENIIGRISVILGKYYIALGVGAVDVEEVYPEFLQALDDAGAETLIQAVQSQLDEWSKE